MTKSRILKMSASRFLRLIFVCLGSTCLELGATPANTNPWDKGHDLIPPTTKVWSPPTTSAASRREEDTIPSFKVEGNSTLITSAGQNVYLHCRVDNLGDRQVSWIRRSDLKILTIGETVYTLDSRITPLHEEGSDVWVLKIVAPVVEDSGEYECQVSYHDDEEKKLKMAFSLTVLDSRAFIQDSASLYVQTGSRLSLSCRVLRPSTPPSYVYWYRNAEVLNYSPNVKIRSALTTVDDTPSSGRKKSFQSWSSGDDSLMVSHLNIDHVDKKHTGNYTCDPSNAFPTSVMVHVVDDESGPAAMQHGNGASLFAPFISLCLHPSSFFAPIIALWLPTLHFVGLR